MGGYAFLRKLYNECTLKLGIAQDFKLSSLSCKHTKIMVKQLSKVSSPLKGNSGRCFYTSSFDPSQSFISSEELSQKYRERDLELPLSGRGGEPWPGEGPRVFADPTYVLLFLVLPEASHVLKSVRPEIFFVNVLSTLDTHTRTHEPILAKEAGKGCLSCMSGYVVCLSSTGKRYELCTDDSGTAGCM